MADLVVAQASDRRLKASVVITSIYPPTDAVRAFTEREELAVIVVGDKKSPQQYDLNSATFLPWHTHSQLGFGIAQVLPFNHYCRKLIGYLEAMRSGAEIIVDTDDDNTPLPSWSLLPFSGTYPTVQSDKGFVNIYELYTDKKIWPRGLPLRLINSRTLDRADLVESRHRVGIWQGLANGDPDVDAIYRLTNGEYVEFHNFGSVVLEEGSLTPLNSQNTIFSNEVFELLYLPSTVTFRFTDILRGLVAQPICWAAGLRVGFTNATVKQDRNPHDYTKDFESEIPMYLHTDQVVDCCTGAVRGGAAISDNLFNCYSALEKANIVASSELTILQSWLSDTQNARKNG